MDSTKTETWLDLTPAIPLVSALPVVDTNPEGDGLGGVVVTLDSFGVYVHYGPPEARPCVEDPGDLRVDLDDPQGFGYALRWLRSQPLGKPWRAEWERDAWFDNMLLRWVTGNTTEIDRLALAHAIAEASR